MMTMENFKGEPKTADISAAVVNWFPQGPPRPPVVMVRRDADIKVDEIEAAFPGAKIIHVSDLDKDLRFL